jgi:hypothetical protein
MLYKKNGKSPDDFWREYEESIGEKVLARSLGQYMSGWEEFDSRKWTGIWGLIIATSGGFRFHHFPQAGWIDIFTRFGDYQPPKEKTFFIPQKNIISAALIKETKWWKKILNSPSPRLIIHYRDDADNERKLLLETGYASGDLPGKLTAPVL